MSGYTGTKVEVFEFIIAKGILAFGKDDGWKVQAGRG